MLLCFTNTVPNFNTQVKIIKIIFFKRNKILILSTLSNILKQPQKFLRIFGLENQIFENEVLHKRQKKSLILFYFVFRIKTRIN